jgi:hypothetical protein
VLRIRWRLLTGLMPVCATTANSKISAKRATKPCFFRTYAHPSNRYHAYLSHRLSACKTALGLSTIFYHATGNGLRVVAGTVLASGGTLNVC